MATQTIPENDGKQDGPALALSDLFEANDLLNLFREHSEETSSQTQLSSAQWTLTGEIKRRINSAIAYLDGAVPAYDDDQPSRKFDDEYCILLRGIIVTARNLFREVNEPADGYGINEPAVEVSCALDALVDQLEQAMQARGLAPKPAEGGAA